VVPDAKSLGALQSGYCWLACRARRLSPARFGSGGAVNNAVRQLSGVFGTALAAVLVGQTGTGIEASRAAFLCLGATGRITAPVCLSLPRITGRAAPQAPG